MAIFDIESSHKVEVALVPTAITSDTTTVGEIIDTKGFGGVLFAVQEGTFIDGSFAILLEESDDETFTTSNVVDSDLVLGDLTPLTATGHLLQAGYIGKKRYVRLSIVSTLVSSGAAINALVIKGKPHNVPA